MEVYKRDIKTVICTEIIFLLFLLIIIMHFMIIFEQFKIFIVWIITSKYNIESFKLSDFQSKFSKIFMIHALQCI